ncbi:MAG: glycerophosphodiester phosphodiesterase [Tenericutes bacterium HGW-Tenericutes-3]|nr:MAG: glycerophosphodiester phosphodiesterase [Tenericutes bacterium HGW-Tenericutes-3]
MKNLDWLKNNLIAHRGLHTKDQSVPENSVASYKAALQKGYSIELDLNVLKDGTVLAFHDHNFKRLCNDPRELKDVTYEECKDFTLLNTTEKIPRFDQVLKLVDGKVPLLIELKPQGDVIFLCQSFMKMISSYQGKWAVFSFHPKVVSWFKKNHPEVIRGQISEYFKDDKKMNSFAKYLMKSLFFNRFTKPDFVSYGIYDMPNKYLDKQMKKGLTIISYAARSQEDFDFVKSHYHNTVFEFFEPKK